MMRAKVLIVLGIVAVALAAPLLVHLWTNEGPVPQLQPPSEFPQPVLVPPQVESESHPARGPAVASAPEPEAPTPTESPSTNTNKVERLAQLRDSYRSLAAGDPVTAMRAARQLTNAVELETALLTLATEWTKGELSSPAQRARAILRYGLEAGLGMELARNPELATLWATELTEDRGRYALLEATAAGLLESDPYAALALGERLPREEQDGFTRQVMELWATVDTEAALQWVSRMGDPVQQNSALESIRNVAPVGIGAAVAMQNGYPVIQELVPGAPAQSSGQLQPGDRILALGQDGTTFVGTKDLPLEAVVKMIRGAPGTAVHLQIQRANAAPNTPPQTIWVTRDQVKFKQQGT